MIFGQEFVCSDMDDAERRERVSLQHAPIDDLRREITEVVEEEYGGEIDSSEFTYSEHALASSPLPGDPYTTIFFVVVTYGFSKRFSERCGERLADFIFNHLEDKVGSYDDDDEEYSGNKPLRLQVEIVHVDDIEDFSMPVIDDEPDEDVEVETEEENSS